MDWRTSVQKKSARKGSIRRRQEWPGSGAGFIWCTAAQRVPILPSRTRRAKRARGISAVAEPRTARAETSRASAATGMPSGSGGRSARTGAGQRLERSRRTAASWARTPTAIAQTRQRRFLPATSYVGRVLSRRKPEIPRRARGCVRFPPAAIPRSRRLRLDLVDLRSRRPRDATRGRTPGLTGHWRSGDVDVAFGFTSRPIRAPRSRTTHSSRSVLRPGRAHLGLSFVGSDINTSATTRVAGRSGLRNRARDALPEQPSSSAYEGIRREPGCGYRRDTSGDIRPRSLARRVLGQRSTEETRERAGWPRRRSRARPPAARWS